MAEDRDVVIADEIMAHRAAWGKVRGFLRVALARNTKEDYRQGCLAVLMIADGVEPLGRGFHGGSEPADSA